MHLGFLQCCGLFHSKKHCIQKKQDAENMQAPASGDSALKWNVG